MKILNCVKYILFLSLCFSLLFASPFSRQIARANIFSEFGISDEIELGKEFEVLVKSKLPLVEDPEIKNYVNGLMHKILEQVPPQPFKYESHVVFSNTLNAFASPGGILFFFTGLLVELKNEAQLAGIMAHEIAHATQRHIADSIDRSKYLSLASLAGMLIGALAGGDGGAAVAGASSAAGQAATLSYSRQNETDADNFGIQYMIKSGFNPLGLAEAFEILQANTLGRSADFPTYLSTHPALSSRIATVKSQVKNLAPEILNRSMISPNFLRVKALSMAYFADGRSAERHFANPKTALDYMGIGILSSRKHQLQNAKNAFATAIKLAPNDYLIFREAGRFYYGIGEFKSAHKMLTKALKINPKDYMATFFYARTLDSENRHIEAQKYYLEVLEYVPEDSEVYNFYGRSLGKSGKIFDGYLALAYAAMYSNNDNGTKKWLNNAKKHKKTELDDEKFEDATKTYLERKKIWN